MDDRSVIYSAVVPLFNEESNIHPLLERLKKVMESLRAPYEIIFVDDGSTDQSAGMLKAIALSDPAVKVITFKKNSGQHKAVAAGFLEAKGSYIITLDADLQNPPEEIPRLLDKMKEGFDMVAGCRKMRKDNIFRRFSSYLVNILIGALNGLKMKDYGSMLRVFRKETARKLAELFNQTGIYITMLIPMVTKNVAEIEVSHDARFSGESKYNTRKLLSAFFKIFLYKNKSSEKILLAALLAVFIILTFTSVIMKSPICDESGHHIAAGYSFLKTGDFRMNPSTPPLIRIIMALPLLLLDLKVPTSHESWVTINSSDFSYQFFFVQNKDAELVVFLSRLPMIFISVLMGLLIFIWAKRIYGSKGGFFALTLYVFSPTILGNAGLAMLDMGCAFLIFLAIFRFRTYLKEGTFLNIILAGVCFGIAQAAKLTSLILYPIFLIISGCDIVNRRDGRLQLAIKHLKNTIIMWLIGLFVLWGTYFFEFKPLLHNAPDIEEKIEYIKKLPVSDRLINFAKNTPIPLSAYFISFLGVAKSISMGEQKLFFMGHDYMSGSKIYYLVVYLIKTPLPGIILLILSALFFKRRARMGPLENIFLLVPIAMVFITASFSKLQGGLRYILPIYPFLFVWIGGLVTVNGLWTDVKRKMVLYALIIWYILAALFAYPHYLAYFNELVGGPDGFGYKITADADWGQDFKELKKYVDKKGIKKIRMYCFGTIDSHYYGIPSEEFAEEDFIRPLPKTFYAISVRYFNNVKWTKDYIPINKVAHTIFIYYIEKAKET